MRRVRRGERGSALVIALVFLGVFSLILMVTLTAASDGLHVDQTLKVEPQRLYAADGAVESAIQQVRYNANKGIEGDTSCGSLTTPQINGKNYYISCEPQSGSGRQALGGSSPTLGILALSNGGSTEIAYQQNGNSIVRLDGGLYSSTPVLFQNGNRCSTSSDVNCQQLNLCPNNAKTVTDARIGTTGSTAPSKAVSSDSAGFLLEDVGVPIRGSGIAGGSTISSYSNSKAVAISNNATAGANKTVTFREDYPRLQNHCHPDVSAKGRFTAVNSGVCSDRVVAVSLNCTPGTAEAVGVDPNYAADQTSFNSTLSFPACGDATTCLVDVYPGYYTDVNGLNVLTTACDKLIWFHPGTYYFNFLSGTPVWTIGNSSLKNLVVAAGDRTWEARTVGGVADPNGVFLGSVSNNGSTVSTASSTFTQADVGKYINSGYSLAYGTKITAVADSAHATLSSPARSGVTAGPFTIGSQDSLCDKTTDHDHPGAEFIFGGASRLNAIDGKTEVCAPVVNPRQQIAIYGAKGGQGVLDALNGCVVQQPYPGVGCPLVQTSGPKVVFLIHGTFYAPGAAIDLSLQTVGYQVVSRGIIARVVALGISPSAGFTDPVIYSPDFGSVARADRRMLFTACADNPCSSGGKPKLRAMVRMQDHDEANNQVFGYKTTVESWTFVR